MGDNWEITGTKQREGKSLGPTLSLILVCTWQAALEKL